MNSLEIDRYLAKIRHAQIHCSAGEPMCAHTTFRIGGPADAYVAPSTSAQLQLALNSAKEMGIRAFVVGRGSNLLFDDAGFRGAVISTTSMCAVEMEDGILHAEAGASLISCAKTALHASYTGLEFAYGIPGSIGGAVFMNAGAYDGEISGILSESTYYDRDNETICTLDARSHQFGYRDSIYRHHPHWVILSASFSLQPCDAEQIRGKMDDFMQRRVNKQPLEYPSAGSIFKRYPGRYTAQMIDEAGLKGLTIGGAQISEKHAGFIINRGGATAGDVLRLIDRVKTELLRKFGVEIETEVVYIPEC